MQELSKSNLRKRLKSQRSLFARTESSTVGQNSARYKVRENLQKLVDELNPQGEVWAYQAYSDEAPCEFEVSKGKAKVAYPKIVKDQLEFYIPRNPQEMVPNHYGILEPDPQKSQPSQDPKLVFVPGVAFDRHGTRLGSGKGFYDRVLSQFPKAIRVGVAYAVQISNEVLPVEAHDQAMDWIVTENFILQCERRG